MSLPNSICWPSVSWWPQYDSIQHLKWNYWYSCSCAISHSNRRKHPKWSTVLWKIALQELYPILYLSVVETTQFLTWSWCSFHKFVYQGAGELLQNQAAQLSLNSLIEVSLFLLPLFSYKQELVGGHECLLLHEHNLGDTNGTFFAYILQETEQTKIWILLPRGFSHVSQSVDPKRCLPPAPPPPAPALPLHSHTTPPLFLVPEFQLPLFQKTFFCKLEELSLLICLSLIFPQSILQPSKMTILICPILFCYLSSLVHHDMKLKTVIIFGTTESVPPEIDFLCSSFKLLNISFRYIVYCLRTLNCKTWLHSIVSKKNKNPVPEAVFFGEGMNLLRFFFTFLFCFCLDLFLYLLCYFNNIIKKHILVSGEMAWCLRALVTCVG